MNLLRFSSCLLVVVALAESLSAQTNTTTIAGNNPTGDAAVLSLSDTSAANNWNLHMLDASNTGRFAVSKGTFGDNGSEFLTILTSGNIGIGTSTPDTGAKLQVTGGILTNAAFSSTVGGTGGMDYFSTGLRLFSMGASGSTKGTFMFYAKGADNSSSIPLVIDSSGSVGIGTMSPADKLHVVGTSMRNVFQETGNGGYATLKFVGQNSNGTNNVFEAGINIVADNLFTISDGSTPLFNIGNLGNVGIGTIAPSSLLTVSATNLAGGVGGEPTYGGTIKIISDGQTAGVADRIGGLEFKAASSGAGYGFKIIQPDLGTGETPLYIEHRSNSASWVNAMTILNTSGNVGIGTTNPGIYKLAVLGKIRAQEVVVDTGWSDYVFKPDYSLASLSEVEGAIKRDGHLPGIPSAQEVAEHGVSMGEMQSKLLAKIEELTLHVIEQEKRQSAHEQQISAQAGRIQKLEAENAALRAGHHD